MVCSIRKDRMRNLRPVFLIEQICSPHQCGKICERQGITMNKYLVKNTVTNETQVVYGENSMLAKRAVCSCNGWDSRDCSVRMIG